MRYYVACVSFIVMHLTSGIMKSSRRYYPSVTALNAISSVQSNVQSSVQLSSSNDIRVGTWIAILSKGSHKSNLPVAVEVVGERLIAYKDPKTGGWSVKKDARTINGKDDSPMKEIPVHSTGDLLWAYMTLPEGQASHYPTLPEIVMPELMDIPLWTVRELPYSFDFLVENFLDPSHLHFAHHTLQAVSSDGTNVIVPKPVNIEK
jgi:hypothetical protein